MSDGWRPTVPIRTSLDVGDVLILPDDPNWYTVTGMQFLGDPVSKLTVELQVITENEAP